MLAKKGCRLEDDVVLWIFHHSLLSKRLSEGIHFAHVLAIELDGSKFGTNNGTTDLIELSRIWSYIAITSYFAPETP